jgi:hypothetical protein
LSLKWIFYLSFYDKQLTFLTNEFFKNLLDVINISAIKFPLIQFLSRFDLTDYLREF